LFGLHAVAASWDKSSTYDEPLHLMSSALIVGQGDFRVNPEHPALWKYVAGLGLLGQMPAVQENSPAALKLFLQLEQQWYWMRDTIYATPTMAAQTERLVGRARVMMAIFTVALGVAVIRWGWRWGGPLAATIALGLLAFDPNLLAHGALVTNDVASCVWFTFAAYLTWQLGVRFSWKTIVLLGLVCAAGVTTKYTCLLLALTVGVPLAYRLVDKAPWLDAAGRLLDGGSRVLRLISAGVCVMAISWLLLWPVYLFRSGPTADGMRFDDRYVRMLYGFNKAAADQLRDPAAPQLNDVQLAAKAQTTSPGLASGLFFFLTERGLVPQAWGYGLNYANARSFIRSAYLMDERSPVGFTTYFPLALAVKTPLATLALTLAAGVVGMAMALRRVREPAVRWKVVCLLVPPMIYFAVACSSSLNIGVRHVLPVLPAAYVGVGVVLAHAIRAWRPAGALVGAGVVALAVETLSVFPNYIPFFNVAAGGSRGGLTLLGDSNLDWGQDLPALSRWHQEWRAQNPNEPFYLSYFGTCPPGAYGIEYINAVPGTEADPRPPTSDLSGGVYAVSATHLQSVYNTTFEDAMRRLRQSKPLAIINGSIYIYAMRRPPGTSSTSTPSPTQP
jgi:hypothetical protein